MSIVKFNSGFLFLLIVVLLVFSTAIAQTTAFTYQGKLVDSGNLANGNYDLQFKLFDTVTVGTGTQQGSAVTVSNVVVSNGIFTVQLDFGVCASCFNGANRFLEISVKPTSGGSFTTLGPRQPVTSNPYAIKSLNAANATTADGLSVACVNCITSSQIQSVSGSAVTGQIPVASVPTGSGNYVQNTTSQQAATNFNISGNGTAGGALTAGIVNAVNQVNINGLRAFTVNGAYNDDGEMVFTATNTFTGDSAGVNTTPSGTLNNASGKFNSFYGAGAGQLNTTGANNAFFGFSAGAANTGGGANAFFGYRAGAANTTGPENAFFGYNTGGNTNGAFNSFFGAGAGISNTTGAGNAFFGRNAGLGNTTGSQNIFIGRTSGFTNSTGSNNTIIGDVADVSTGNLDHATAIGAGAVASLSNSIYLGRADGSDAVRIPGPVVINGSLVVGTLGSAGSTSICLNVANRIAPCSSSLRYKANVQPFTGGLDIVRRLRPISFTWKDGGMSDVGFAAEEVNQVEPLLTTYNKDGQIEGVKYGQMTTVLINAVKEQQAQISEQQRIIQQQQRQLEALKQVVCEGKPQAAICRDK